MFNPFDGKDWKEIGEKIKLAVKIDIHREVVESALSHLMTLETNPEKLQKYSDILHTFRDM